jgi:uncharacterized protein
MTLEFAWDPAKARTNSRKHGVTFVEAMTVFDDPAACLRWDQGHDSPVELRGKVIGYSQRNRLLAVIFTERYETIRIISAWKAYPAEETAYAEALR